MTRMISFAVLIAFIILVGMLFYNVMIGFFVPVFLAAVLVVVFNPLHRWVLDKVGQRPKVAAAATTTLILLSVLLPISLVLFAASVQGLRLVSQVNASSIYVGMTKVRDSFGLRMEHGDLVREADQSVKEIVSKVEELPFATKPPENVVALVGQAKASLTKLQEAAKVKWGTELDKSFEDLIQGADSIANPTTDPEDVTEEQDPELNLQQATSQFANRFSVLKTKILGGSYLAFAKELTNPTRKQIHELTDQFVSYLRPRLLTATGATSSYLARAIFGGVIMLIATFFFLLDGPGMINSLMKLSPLDDRYEHELLQEFDRISRAVVLATLFSALAQGATASFGYLIAGWASESLFDSLPLLFLLTTFFALIPFVGPAVVWVPVCLYLTFFEDRPGAAILLALWGVLVVGTIDNVVKAVVLHGQSQLHPLLALLSVLGGVQSLGPVGIVIGPMVVAILQTLLSILQRELEHFEQQREKVINASHPLATEAVPLPTHVLTTESGDQPVETDRKEGGQP
jgi:predicted PurR-regulated permease PerM